MSLWKLLMILLPLIAGFPTIIAKVEAFIKAGDWAGLIAYLESLLQNPIPGVPAEHLEPVVDGLKALKL